MNTHNHENHHFSLEKKVQVFLPFPAKQPIRNFFDISNAKDTGLDSVIFPDLS